MKIARSRFTKVHFLKLASRLKAPIPQLRMLDLVIKSHLFDLEYYRPQVKNETFSLTDAIYHYLRYGIAQDLNPNSHFNTRWYLKTYPDVAGAGVNPLVHYIRNGASEGRNPSPGFETSWYLTQYPDVANNGVNPLTHFLRHGLSEGRSPIREETTWYVNEYLEQAAGVNPLPNRKAENPALVRRLSNVKSRILPSDGIIREHRSFNVAAMVDVAHERGWPIFHTDERSAVSFHNTGDASNGGTSSAAVFPPAPFVVHANDVVVIGGIRHILANENTIIHDETAALRHGLEFICKLHHTRALESGQISIEIVRRAGNIVDCGIHAMHEYANNYFHLVTEVLPRIYVARQDPSTKNVPLLINEGLHPNFLELLSIVDEGRITLPLEKLKLYTVGKLHYPSDVSSIQDVYVRPRKADDTTLHTSIIRRVIEKILDVKGFRQPAKSHRKIYLRRGRRYRGLLNEEKIEAKLKSSGFETLIPEDFSIAEQIRMFREAAVVIAPTGAGLTNLVWCQPKTKVLVLAAKHPSMPLEVWTQLGEVSECTVNSLQGPRANNRQDMYDMHDDYSIPLPMIEAWVEQLG